jgi:hypothetical protein
MEKPCALTALIELFDVHLMLAPRTQRGDITTIIFLSRPDQCHTIAVHGAFMAELSLGINLVCNLSFVCERKAYMNSDWAVLDS